MFFIFLIIIFLLSIVEATVWKIPLVLICILLGTVLYKRTYFFFLGIFGGIFLDFLNFNIVGPRSIFFTIFIAIIFLYQKRFELKSFQFVSLMIILGSLGYLIFFGSENLFLQAAISWVVAVVLFFLLEIIPKSNKLSYNI